VYNVAGGVLRAAYCVLRAVARARVAAACSGGSPDVESGRNRVKAIPCNKPIWPLASTLDDARVTWKKLRGVGLEGATAWGPGAQRSEESGGAPLRFG
jgi:hypothetical protein